MDTVSNSTFNRSRVTSKKKKSLHIQTLEKYDKPGKFFEGTKGQKKRRKKRFCTVYRVKRDHLKKAGKL